MFISEITPTVVKLLAGTKMIQVTITKEGDRLYFKFGFNKPLMAYLKTMDGARYHGYDDVNPRKIWSITDNLRNHFQLDFLAHPGKDDPLNPFHWYDRPLIDFVPRRECMYIHQRDMCANGLTYHYWICGAEMGTGKTLSAIEIMEQSKAFDWWYIAPKSALVAVQADFRKWKASVTPKFMTYESLKRELDNWPADKKPPQGVIFDESSRCKNKTAQRTQAAQHLADAIRTEWGYNGFVIEMTGTPAPKSPVDWWSQCEIACPGFLREGHPEKLKHRLGIVVSKQTFEGGGQYPSLASWRDDEKKCDICGLLEDAETHGEPDTVDVFGNGTTTCHKFVPSVNEIAKLYRRMKGLVKVYFKKDCLSLPDKIYREIECKPTRSILNAARAIKAKSPSTIVAMTLLRELSDGFQYVQTPEGEDLCPNCKGTKTEKVLITPDGYQPSPEEFETGHYVSHGADGERILGEKLVYHEEEHPCNACSGVGSVVHYVRVPEQVPCPKEQVLLDLLDEHDDVGRLVVYGGFTGTLDRLALVAKKAKWNYIRVDGRGWFSDIPGKPRDLYERFQTGQATHPRVVFVAHPGSAGMGLTLTASPSIVYYSNDFNAESRIQSEDRIHRPGMDLNRGATIIDIFHLPTDRLVWANLKKKRELQAMSMGEVQVALESIDPDEERQT